jgi:hypothetical protein
MLAWIDLYFGIYIPDIPDGLWMRYPNNLNEGFNSINAGIDLQITHQPLFRALFCIIVNGFKIKERDTP